ncbi:MAG: hypothetical protein JRH20_12925 [Deltaproteobacteria bacterium]|nr:hypothetical protein [Deltaproteobacteria bacterium]
MRRLPLFFVLLTTLNCSGFRAADADGALSEASTKDVLDSSQDTQADTLPDTPAAPHDEPCLELWTESTGEGACAGRRVVEIAKGVLDSSDVAIAVTSENRRVVIAYQNYLWADEAKLHLTSFGVEPGAAITRRELEGLSVVRMGDAFDLAPSVAGDTVHLMRADLESSTNGEITYQSVDGETLQLGNASLLANDVSAKTKVGVFEANNGEIFGLYYNDLNGTIYWRRRIAADQGWSAATTVTGLSNVDGIGAGHFALARQHNGLPALVYTFTVSDGSQPRYLQFNGSDWAIPKTVDSVFGEAYGGYAATLAIIGTRRVVAHISLTEVFALRLAEWEGVDDVPKISVLDEGPVSDPERPAHDLALAKDNYGLLHLVLIDPGKHYPDTSSGSLDYWRQHTVDGATRWIRDVIMKDVANGMGRSWVDLQVDGGGKPHIAFYNGTTGQVLYVTRDDRL